MKRKAAPTTVSADGGTEARFVPGTPVTVNGKEAMVMGQESNGRYTIRYDYNRQPQVVKEHQIKLRIPIPAAPSSLAEERQDQTAAVEQEPPAHPVTLIPDNKPVWTYVTVLLADLPTDENLPGPAPDPTMIASLRQFGLKDPVDLMQIDGQYVVPDGKRRVKAARVLGWESIPAKLHEGWPFPETMTLLGNAQRSDNAPADLQAIEALIWAGATEKQIAAATGMPVGTLRKRRKLIALPPALRQAFQDGTLCVTAAEASLKLTGSQRAEIVAALEAGEKVTLKRVQDARMVHKGEQVAALPVTLFVTPGPDRREAVETDATLPANSDSLRVMLKSLRQYTQKLKDEQDALGALLDDLRAPDGSTLVERLSAYLASAAV